MSSTGAVAAVSLMSHPNANAETIPDMPLPIQIFCWGTLAMVVIGFIHTVWVTRKFK